MYGNDIANTHGGIGFKGQEYEREIEYVQVGGSLDDAGYYMQRGDEVTVL